jgi:hypothetical protein
LRRKKQSGFKFYSMKKSNNIFKLFLIILTFMFSSTAFSQNQEDIEIATSYPSPVGLYNELRLRHLMVGDEYINNYANYCLGGGCANIIDTNTALIVDGKVGIGTITPKFKLSVYRDFGNLYPNGSIIASGTFNSGLILQTSGPGTRLIWYPRKGAFRAGGVDANQWDDDLGAGFTNIGNYSVAMGYNSQAAGNFSSVGGGSFNRALATAEYSVITGGDSNTTSGRFTTITGGKLNAASADFSTVIGGNQNRARNQHSTIAGGSVLTVDGQFATMIGGLSSTARGDYSVVTGGSNQFTDALATNSAVLGGSSNRATAANSVVAGGAFNQATGRASIVSGGRNNIAAGDYSWAGGSGMQLSAAADRTFVWGYSAVPVTINTPNSFLVFPPDSLGTSVGIMGIGKIPDPAYKVDVNGKIICTTFIDLSSDLRLKTKIKPLLNALKRIEGLRGVTFSWKDPKPGNHKEEKQIGLIAQELERVFPELVTTGKNDGYKSVDYGRFSAVLLEAVKELDSNYEDLEKRVKDLEEKL